MSWFGLGQFGSVSVQAIQHLKDLFKDLQRFFIQYFKDFESDVWTCLGRPLPTMARPAMSSTGTAAVVAVSAVVTRCTMLQCILELGKHTRTHAHTHTHTHLFDID